MREVAYAALGRPSSARPWLGANLQEIDGEVVVRRVAPEGPAAGAGIQHGDRAVAIDGSQVRDLADFYRALSGRTPCDRSPNELGIEPTAS